MRQPAKVRDKRGAISVSAATYARLVAIAEGRGGSIAKFVEERINGFLDRKGWQ